jgi:hypothetical protein
LPCLPRQVQLLQRLLHMGHGLISLTGLLAQTAFNQMLQLWRNIWASLRKRRRMIPKNGRYRCAARIPLKGRFACQHLEQYGPETEDVRPGIYLFALGLLRGHIGNRAHNGSLRRLRGGSPLVEPLEGNCSISFARPKSRTLTSRRSFSIMLPGFRSRCTMPAAWPLSEHQLFESRTRRLPPAVTPAARLLLSKSGRARIS